MNEHKIVGSERSTWVSWETVAAGTKKAPVVLGPAGNFGRHVLFRVKIYTYRGGALLNISSKEKRQIFNISSELVRLCRLV